jgi:predicted  nucleic acid-binding Zn-ribbon protein
LGAGKLKRSEILDRLGVKDFARVAQLSAEEAFRLLLSKHKQDEQGVWLRFETELAKRTAEIEQRHRDELHVLRTAEQEKAHEIERANRRVEDSLREVADLRERNHELESQMSKVARRGKLEEVSFEDEVKTWPGICVSEKLPRNGDFLLAFRDLSGAPLEPRLLIDNKDKTALTEGDIRKLVRDAKERRTPVAVIVTRDETQLRQVDRECRWAQEDGVWVLRTTRQWLPRDLDVLRPLLERMRTEGADFLQNNAAVAEEVRRTLVDLDEVEKELKKAAKAIDTAAGLTSKYRARLQTLCDATTDQKKMPKHQPVNGGVAETEYA